MFAWRPEHFFFASGTAAERTARQSFRRWAGLVQFAEAVLVIWRPTCILAAFRMLVLCGYGIAEYGVFHVIDSVSFVGIAAFLALTSTGSLPARVADAGSVDGRRTRLQPYVDRPPSRNSSIRSGQFQSCWSTRTDLGCIRLGEKTGWFGALRYRYFGPRPLTEDGAFISPATGLLNGQVGYRFENGWRIQLDAFNILDSKSDQIKYAYASLLKSDSLSAMCFPGVGVPTAPVAVCQNGLMDRVLHPVEPLVLRVTLSEPIGGRW